MATMTETQILIEDLEVTLLNRYAEKQLEDQILDAGVRVRNLVGNDEVGYRFQASSDGEGWYNYTSWTQPELEKR